MFDLSKKVDYGLRLMVALAKEEKGKPVSLKLIARQNKLPYKYLGKIAVAMADSGLLESKEGRGGGYFLSKKPGDITVDEVISILEGPIGIDGCAGCPHAVSCGQKSVWGDVERGVRKAVKSKTIKDLL